MRIYIQKASYEYKQSLVCRCWVSFTALNNIDSLEGETIRRLERLAVNQVLGRFGRDSPVARVVLGTSGQ